VRRGGDPELDRSETACIEDAGACEHLGIAGARILRQVADLARPGDPALGGEHVAGEHLRERGLAGAVAADESDLVARGDPERDVRHEHACSDTDLEVMHGEHSGIRSFGGGGRVASLPV